MSVAPFDVNARHGYTHKRVSQVVLPEGTKYETFVLPDCPDCLKENRVNDMLKPEVIFFGESIPAPVRDRS